MNLQQQQQPIYVRESDNNGLPHGQGLITYIDGSTYEGEFSHGQQEGEGEYKR